MATGSTSPATAPRIASNIPQASSARRRKPNRPSSTLRTACTQMVLAGTSRPSGRKTPAPCRHCGRTQSMERNLVATSVFLYTVLLMTSKRSTTSQKKHGFSLIELLLAMGIVGIISAGVIYGLNIRLNFINTYDSERLQHARALEQAQMQYLVKNWELLKESEIPEGEQNAKPICTEGVTSD